MEFGPTLAHPRRHHCFFYPFIYFWVFLSDLDLQSKSHFTGKAAANDDSGSKEAHYPYPRNEKTEGNLRGTPKASERAVL